MLGSMDGTKTTLERAFELAKSGSVLNMAELHSKLKREGYMLNQIDGPTLRRQLSQLMRERAGRPDAAAVASSDVDASDDPDGAA
jgi:hypothetical protein